MPYTSGIKKSTQQFNSIEFGKFNRPSKQQKNKTTFDVVVIESIRNEETEERQQCQTVIIPDMQETDGDQQPNGEDANNFLFHRQRAIRTNQTNTIIHPKVINLFSTCLTDTQVRISNKGLKFTPTPRRSTIETEKRYS